METEHAVEKAKRKTKEWRSYGSSKIPPKPKGGTAEFSLVLLLTSRMWRELKHARPTWREFAARASCRSSAVCSRRDTVNWFEQDLFVSFLFVLDLMSVKKKKQLEARCQPLILTCKTSEEKHPCRTRSNDVDKSIRGLSECPELAHDPLVNKSNSTCNKTNGLVSCLTCISMWNKLSTNWQNCQTVQFEHWGEACCERTLKRLRLHDLRSRSFAAAKAQPMLNKQQELESNSDYETLER